MIEGLPGQEPRSDIDRLIEALAQRQRIDVAGDGDDENNENNDLNLLMALHNVNPQFIASPRASRPGMRRVGDVEGVRQSSGNWQRDSTTPWDKPILARPINPAILDMGRRQM